jgi:hypothetical protein
MQVKASRANSRHCRTAVREAERLIAKPQIQRIEAIVQRRYIEVDHEFGGELRRGGKMMNFCRRLAGVAIEERRRGWSFGKKRNDFEILKA